MRRPRHGHPDSAAFCRHAAGKEEVGKPVHDVDVGPPFPPATIVRAATAGVSAAHARPGRLLPVAAVLLVLSATAAAAAGPPSPSPRAKNPSLRIALLAGEELPFLGLLEAGLMENIPASWVERNEIEKVLTEPELQAAFGADAPQRRTALGKILRADLLVLVRSAEDSQPHLEVVVCENAPGPAAVGAADPADHAARDRRGRRDAAGSAGHRERAAEDRRYRGRPAADEHEPRPRGRLPPAGLCGADRGLPAGAARRARRRAGRGRRHRPGNRPQRRHDRAPAAAVPAGSVPHRDGGRATGGPIHAEAPAGQAPVGQPPRGRRWCRSGWRRRSARRPWRCSTRPSASGPSLPIRRPRPGNWRAARKRSRRSATGPRR